MMFIVIFFLFILLFPNHAEAQTISEEIYSFDSQITIQKDTSISIKETIQYFTSSPKHGIYRYIPQKYTYQGINYSTKTRDISITDDKLESIKFTTSFEKSYKTLKIGDPDRTFHGDKTYLLSYTTDNALKQFEEHNELYWDITGEGWKIPITKTTATINSPYATITKADCFSGKFGLDDGLCRIESQTANQVVISYDNTINFGDNVSVAIALDPTNSQIIFPSDTEKLLRTIRDNISAIIVLFPTVLMFALWYTRGRDKVFVSDNIFDNSPHKPTRLRPIFGSRRTPMVYQPIHQLTPGEAGTILDERVDNQDVIAEIIDLARKKYLSITPAKKTGLIFKKNNYLFTKLKPTDKHLPEHQQYLYEQIFKTGDKVKLSSLKGTFYTAMTTAKSKIYKSATNKKLFSHHPNRTRKGYIAVGILLIGLSFVISIGSINQGSPLPLVLTILQIPLVVFFGYNMVQKSAHGNNYYLQARGLKNTIDIGAWRQRIHEKNLFIEEVLPFAISFGVINKLTRDMKDLNIQPPDYLAAGYASTRGFSTNSFISDFAKSASNSLTYNPSSSSSGGSGFSGGGFSGGGGGGGGGGSW